MSANVVARQPMPQVLQGKNIHHLADTQDGMEHMEVYVHPPSAGSKIQSSGFPMNPPHRSVVLNHRTVNEVVPGPVTEPWTAVIILPPHPMIMEMSTVMLTKLESTTNCFATAGTLLAKVPEFPSPAGEEASIDKCRTISHSVTIELNASAMTDQGRLIAGAFEGSLSKHPAGGAGGDFDDYVLNIDPVTSTIPTSIAGMESDFRMAKAKEGVFYSNIRTGALGLWSKMNPGGVSLPRLTGVNAGGTVYQTIDSFLEFEEEWGVGIIYISGLDPKATLTVKTCKSIEYVVQPDSVYRSLTSPGAEVDRRGVDNALAMRRMMPAAQPASANFLGGLLPMLASAGRAVLAAIRSPVGQQLVSTAGNAVSGLLQNAGGGQKQQTPRQPAPARPASAPVAPRSNSNKKKSKKRTSAKKKGT